MKQMIKSMMLIMGIAALSVGFQSCNSAKSIEKTKLEGNWQLKTLKGEDASVAFKTPAPTLKFNFEDKIVVGNGGCNNYNGVFSLTDKNEFSARNPVATMRACLDANKEPQFFAALATPNMKLSLEDGDNTLLFKKGSEVVLAFVKAAETVDAKQIAGSWILTAISGGDINELFENKPTLEMGEDGKVLGQGGCNSLRTSYTLNGNTITFKGIASTKMACPSLKGESLFTSQLASPMQVELGGNKMSFSKDGNIVLEFERYEVGE